MAIAHVLAGQGHAIQLAGRDPDRLKADAEDLKIRHQVAVSTHRFDVLEPETFVSFFDGLDEVPHAVISAVGLMGDQDASSGDVDQLKLVIDSNFTGPALALEFAAKKLSGLDADTAIVGISSVAGDRGRKKNYVYGSAKAGFTQYLSGLRQKYHGTRLHVMTVKPGFVKTAMTEGMDLPGPLTTEPAAFAKNVVAALQAKKHVYYDLRWRALMGVIKAVPEPIFARLKF
ncbi:MAG: SDR family NAD(P)-dependent oxidoreductase [Alphaproteobacteria bacterium]|nr:SDR family NAD(P)-dependent oxidoreductase [Alphaproteobacteria bacterium]